MISPYTKPEYITSFEDYAKDISSLIAFVGYDCSYIPGIPTLIDFLEALNHTVNVGVNIKYLSENGRLYEGATKIYKGNPQGFYKGISDLIVEATQTDLCKISR